MQQKNANSSEPQNSMMSDQYGTMQNLTDQIAGVKGNVNPLITGIESSLNTAGNNLPSTNSVQMAQSQAQQGVDAINKTTAAQNKNMPPISYEMINVLKNDCQKVDELVKHGEINLQQGIAIKIQLLKNAFETNSSPEKPTDSSNQTADVPSKIIEEFEKENANFFEESEARKGVRDYIQKSFDALSKDELSSVAEMIKTVENEAVKRFQTQMAHEKSLDENNRLAISRLGANSAMEKASNVVSPKVFTRDEIGAMSIDEFKNNEAEIFTQYRKGLIKK